jgi:hypothetical protein
MKRLNPKKLHVTGIAGSTPVTNKLPRRYTLTHSDMSGDLFLTIDNEYDKKQISGFYTRIMRDEVLAELIDNGDQMEFRVYCYISGGCVFGTAALRDRIFHAELPLAIEAIRYGDRSLFEKNSKFDQFPINVYFSSRDKKYNRVESWGVMADYS